MLSQKDYGDYLRQILEVEIEMAGVYRKCVSVTADEEVRRVCGVLMKQEERHAELVREMIALFEVA